MKLAIICFVLCFIVCYVTYLIIISISNKKYRQGRLTAEMLILKFKFNIDYRKVGYLKMRKTISLINSLLISLTFGVTTFTTNFYIIILICVVVLPLLTIPSYFLLGKYYIKKGYVLDERH